ncbi:MAG: polysaccharide biosynthesis tyrosine autokinase [Desulfococcaceae bacterium]|nr:polysaccharide biosynthesis tyrosine autokinase [Desulfococcaceae bacterium]
MSQYDVDIRDYWRIIKKRKALILLMVLLVGSFSYLFGKLNEPLPLYEAEAAVKIESRTGLADFFLQDFWNRPDTIATHAFIIISFPILAETARSLGWIPSDLQSAEIRNAEEHLLQIKRLQTMLRAEQEKNTNILRIRVVSEDPQEAVAVANTLISVYRNYNIQEKNKQTFDTGTFIEEQIRITGKKLAETEEELKSFQKDHDLLIVDLQTSATLKRLYEVESEYEKIQTDKNIVQAQLQLAERQDPENLSGIFVSAEGSTALQDLSKRLSELVMERKTMLVEFTENHPSVIETDDRIESLIYGIRQELRARLKGLQTVESKLAEKLKDLHKKSRSFPDKALRMSRLQREVKLQESLYSQLKAKYQEISIQAAGKVEEVSIIRPATLPGIPVNLRSKISIVITGVLMGLLMGLVFAFLAETLDTSIAAIEDVEHLLQVPVIGTVPQLKKEEIEKTGGEKLLKNPYLITHFAPTSVLSEAFRSVRTNMQFAGREIRGNTFLFTSSFMEEGKTFTVINTALTLAREGRKVLLMGADLRNPTVQKAFGLDLVPGISDFVMGSCEAADIIRTITDLMVGDMDVDDILVTPGLDNLNYVTCGSPVSNPSEILRSVRFRDFLQSVKKEYDTIMIDGPSVLPVADALDIALLADGVFIVYKIGKIGRGVLKRAKSALDQVNARVLGVILNGVKPETGPDYFAYQTQYYGKTEEKKENRKWGIRK